MSDGLFWTPLFDHIPEVGENCILLISPFIQRRAIERLIENIEESDSLQVVARWNPSDIVSGVSNLEVYPYLDDLGIPLYINSRIHLKLTIFEDDNAFHSSANVTHRGLGIGDESNIEVGCQVRLSGNDWHRIHELLETSVRVDDAIFDQAKKYLAENKDKRPPLPKLQYKSKQASKEFSRHSLPFAQNPDLLWDYYDADEFDGSRANFAHDLVLYSVQDPGLGREEFLDRLELNFKRHPFIKSVAGLIEREGSLRFGAVNDWITGKCTDKPVPFRWEIKPATNRLYDWLEYFFDEISWDRPNHSQVIYWKDDE